MGEAEQALERLVSSIENMASIAERSLDRTQRAQENTERALALAEKYMSLLSLIGEAVGSSDASCDHEVLDPDCRQCLRREIAGIIRHGVERS